MPLDLRKIKQLIEEFYLLTGRYPNVLRCGGCVVVGRWTVMGLVLENDPKLTAAEYYVCEVRKDKVCH